MEYLVDPFIKDGETGEVFAEYLAPMFSVPILHIKVDDWDNKKKCLLEMFQILESDKEKFRNNLPTDVRTDYHYNYETGENYNEEVSEILQSELQEIADTFDCSVEVNTSWFELTKKYQYHTCHNHGAAGLSCVCFIEFDEKKHKPTIFLNPLSADDKHFQFVPPNVREGSLIVFPSYVLHFTESNQTDTDRLILSFNLTTDLGQMNLDEDSEYCSLEDSEYCSL